MTATEELRRLLDERGVKWMPVAWNPKRETFYHAANGVGFCADEYTDGVKIYTDATITPEQAIAATLGSCNCMNGERTGTCNADETETWDCVCDQIGRYGKRVTIHVMECSACGGTYEHVNGSYEFCPRCGRRVEVDG